ncbi:MAG: YebC/PmpR family DNA-binding transcriptional regulator [Alphaproteobacteria bacterium]
MAGHSQFKNIMYRKGAQDAKKSRIFSKITREIIVAIRAGGTDPSTNPRLRTALSLAKTANMPKQNIERAFNRATGADSDALSYEEVRYEGFGPSGVAFIIETLTDNKNRTTSEIRSTFSKHGGNLAELGSVSFLFEYIGFFLFSKRKIDFTKAFEVTIDAGALTIEENDEFYEVTCPLEKFAEVRDKLTPILGEPKEARAIWKTNDFVPCEEQYKVTLSKLIEVLDDNEDVQHIYTNAVED